MMINSLFEEEETTIKNRLKNSLFRIVQKQHYVQFLHYTSRPFREWHYFSPGGSGGFFPDTPGKNCQIPPLTT